MKKLDWQKILYLCIGQCCLSLAVGILLIATTTIADTSPQLSSAIFDSLPVDEVWAGTSIAYDAISVGPIVYIAYYDAERRFSVARVDTATHTVAKKTLDSVFAGWDAHNSVVLAYDRNGYLHVAGNMHAVPLIYARTLRPNDFNSLTQTNRMVGNDESSVTYPNFFFLANGDLLFSYRSGKSGNGAELINRFDGERWLRLLQQPLFAPASESDPVNAYHTAYILGPDSYYHVAWVWRKTHIWSKLTSMLDMPVLKIWCIGKIAASVFLICRLLRRMPRLSMTSRRMVACSTMSRLGFDAKGKPVISYLKYDKEGNSQLYHARPGKGSWQIKQATDWKYRWAFSGGGTLVNGDFFFRCAE